MRDYIDIGPVPAEEDCEQLGPNYDASKARKECNAYIEAIRRVCGPEPQGAQLRIKANQHDFGTYYEVVCYYDTENQAAFDYALKCESDAPQRWPDDLNPHTQDKVAIDNDNADE